MKNRTEISKNGVASKSASFQMPLIKTTPVFIEQNLQLKALFGLKWMKLIFLSLVFLLFNSALKGQITILSAGINSYNITAQSLCGVTIMNYGKPVNVYLKARIISSDNEQLMIVRSNTFLLNKGLNASAGMNVSIQSVEYGTSKLSGYIKSSHTLPSGKYHYCCTVVPLDVPYETEEFCDDIESEMSSFLNLVSPDDKDTIETTNPLLIWNHNDPVNMNSSGEYYRLILVELHEMQTAESGINVNNPKYMKNNVSSNQVQYPFDAEALQVGKRYGWQVQKLSNGVIVEKTDAWEFTIMPDNTTRENKYVSLRKELNAGFYTAENNKVFFRFEEAYSGGKLDCRIYDSKRKLIKPKTKNEATSGQGIDVKKNGYNSFVIDLNLLDIKTGFHTLEVRNQKNELFLLKFYVK
jgi:hypothetical protein